MVQFARPRKYEAPANRLLPGGGMRGVGELPGGLGDGTPLPMPAGMPNPAVGSRGAQNGNRRYMGGGGGDDGGGGGGGSGGYATQGYDSQRSQGYPSQDGYGMHSTQQSLGCLSLDSSQPGYASQGYDAQVQPRATRHAPTRPRAHALPRPRAAAPPRGRAPARPRWRRPAPRTAPPCNRVTHSRHAAPRGNCWLPHVAQGYYSTQPYSQPYGAPLSQSDERGGLSLSQDSQGYSFSAHSQDDTGYRGAYDYGAAHMAYDYSAPASQPGPHTQGS